MMRSRKVDNSFTHDIQRKTTTTTTVGFLSLSISFVMGYLLSSIGRNVDSSSSSSSLRGSLQLNDCLITIGDAKYKGTQYTTTTTIGTPKCLVESKFLKVQQHRVRLEGSKTNNNNEIIEDWLWIDYHDRINVLIEAPPIVSSNNNDHQEPHFIILQQTKYALEGRTSLAIVGGIIEPGETPEHAARREVLEETGSNCNQFDFLGRYRTDVNRGMGWTNTYVARMCTATSNSSKKKQSATVNVNAYQHSEVVTQEEVGKADTEQQDIITMSLSQVREAVIAGQFLEIQWSATVALALLLYDHNVVI